MTLTRLLLRSLLYHGRGNLAVLLGVAVGTAVLTGALFVGDSLRGSLRDLALKRLGWVDQALISGQFIRESLANDLPAGRVAPAFLLRGTATDATGDRTARSVTIMGVESRFWPGSSNSFWNGTTAEVVLNRTLADALGATVGQSISLQMTKPGAVPRKALLGKRDADALGQFKVTVRAILNDAEFGSSFGLQAATEAARNAFVPLHFLQGELQQPGRVNALFAADVSSDFDEKFAARLDLDDWGLVLQSPKSRADALFAQLDRNDDKKLSGREWYEKRGTRRIPRLAGAVAATALGAASINDFEDIPYQKILDYYEKQHPYLSLESRQLILTPGVAQAALEAAKAANLRAAPTLAYMAKTISDGKAAIPYSVVVALDPSLPPPLGRFLPAGAAELHSDQILLAGWPDSPLKDAKPGTKLTLTYFEPESHNGAFVEKTAEFTLAGRVPLTGAALDPGLTPELPGLTDKVSASGWEAPPPFDNKSIRKLIKPDDINELYWESYRTTPKAYITLERGQSLWRSRFGNLTSIRLAPEGGGSLADAEAAFRKELRDRLHQDRSGLTFQPIKRQALAASVGGTDFGPLFLGFSCFLIVAALLLVGLLVRLNLDRRAAEIGLLLASGYRPSTIFRLLLAEGAVLGLVGAAVGIFLALGYTRLLLQLLALLWPGGVLQSFLHPHYRPMSFLIGVGSSLLVTWLTIALASRNLRDSQRVSCLRDRRRARTLTHRAEFDGVCGSRLSASSALSHC